MEVESPARKAHANSMKLIMSEIEKNKRFDEDAEAAAEERNNKRSGRYLVEGRERLPTHLTLAYLLGMPDPSYEGWNTNEAANYPRHPHRHIPIVSLTFDQLFEIIEGYHANSRSEYGAKGKITLSVQPDEEDYLLEEIVFATMLRIHAMGDDVDKRVGRLDECILNTSLASNPEMRDLALLAQAVQGNRSNHLRMHFPVTLAMRSMEGILRSVSIPGSTMSDEILGKNKDLHYPLVELFPYSRVAISELSFETVWLSIMRYESNREATARIIEFVVASPEVEVDMLNELASRMMVLLKSREDRFLDPEKTDISDAVKLVSAIGESERLKAAPKMMKLRAQALQYFNQHAELKEAAQLQPRRGLRM